MESIATVLTNITCTSHETNHALNRDNTKHVACTCTTYETIPKREYGLLLRQMESWKIAAPKAIVKKYGVFIVKRAVEYTKATPNVRNRAGYMTYMCQQFKKDTETNHVAQNAKPQSKITEVKEEKCVNIPKTQFTLVKNDCASGNDENLVPCPPEIMEKMKRMCGRF